MGAARLLAFATLASGVVAFGAVARPRSGVVRASRRADARAAAVGMSTRGDGLPCGSLVALTTPMTASGAVDEQGLRGLLRWHIESGTDGLVVLGTTGEASMLSAAERTNVLRITQEEAVGKLPVIIGTGTIEPSAVIKMGEEAARFGADGVLVVTPYYVKPTQKGLMKFFEMIADDSSLPVVLYNVPGRTGVDMTPITIGELSKHKRIVGVKVRAVARRSTRTRPHAPSAARPFRRH
jgi:4-hydroxy-tetrahydrodipicolinate synthase